MDNIYYIYFHINPLKNEIFYVGKGKDKRAWSKSKRSNYWKNIVKKYGFIVDVVEDNLTEDEAFEREIFYIRKIGRKDLKTGPLVNLTDGGEGGINKILSNEHRERISKSLKGNKRAQGKKLSDEHKEKIGQGSKNRIRDNEYRNNLSIAAKNRKVNSMSGKKHSEETKLKMSESAKNRNKKPLTNQGFLNIEI